MPDSGSAPESRSGPDARSAPEVRNPRAAVWQVIKWLLFAAVLVAVTRQAWQLSRQVGEHSMRPNFALLLVAAVATLAGWLTSVRYWQSRLSDIGVRVSFSFAARAYLVGGLGKYIPGKAAAVVLRTALLRQPPRSLVPIGVVTTEETLASMGLGSALLLALLPWMWISFAAAFPAPAVQRAGQFVATQPPVVKVAYAAAMLVGSLIGMRLGTGLLERLSRKLFKPPATDGSDSAATEIPLRASNDRNWGEFLHGFFLLMLGWWLQGLALLLTIRAVAPAETSVALLPLCTAVNAAAIVLGFVALVAPGGMGVRELVFMTALEPIMGPAVAVAVAVLLRLVNLLTELLAAGLLWCCVSEPKTAATQN